MSFKTITVDVEAYELLRSRKRPGQSFSEVIKRGMRRGGTGADLLAALERSEVDPRTTAAIDRVVRARGKSRPKIPKL
ncbi:MAG: antitoxin VapB family protein [Thermoanaerobaculia bacterium]